MRETDRIRSGDPAYAKPGERCGDAATEYPHSWSQSSVGAGGLPGNLGDVKESGAGAIAFVESTNLLILENFARNPKPLIPAQAGIQPVPGSNLTIELKKKESLVVCLSQTPQAFKAGFPLARE